MQVLSIIALKSIQGGANSGNFGKNPFGSGPIGAIGGGVTGAKDGKLAGKMTGPKRVKNFTGGSPLKKRA